MARLKRRIALWCLGWAHMIEGIVSVVTFTLVTLPLGYRIAFYFAKKRWF